MRQLSAAFVLTTLLVLPVTFAQSQDGPSADWPAPETVADHEQEVLAFRQGREASLRQAESWLTLVGLFWLREGSNTLGSGDADLKLPEKAPDFVGDLVQTTTEDGRTVVFTPADGVGIGIDGQPVAGPVELKSDSQGEPTQVDVGDFVFYLIERRDEVAVRVKDRRAPTLTGFQGLDFYPVDWRWRLEGRFVPYEEGKEIQVPSVLGGSDTAEIPGAVEFDRNGETYRLDALPGGEDTLFLIFGDATNGEETYGGGRFLYIPSPPAANREAPVVIDFNKAYSPPCVFSPWATCPLPPPQNKLGLAVTAGEKMYHGPTEGGH